MASSKELCSIREWAPLTEIIEQIPARLQRGFFPANLNLTCVDATEEFLAIGSDAGIVFWYNRYTGEMQKLKAEVCPQSMTHFSTLGHACGSPIKSTSPSHFYRRLLG